MAKEESLKEVNAVKTSLEVDYNEFLNALSSHKDNLKADLSAKLPELRAALNAKLSKI